MKSFYSDYISHISDILDKKTTLRTFSVNDGLEKAVVNGGTIREANESTSLPAVITGPQKSLSLKKRYSPMVTCASIRLKII